MRLQELLVEANIANADQIKTMLNKIWEKEYQNSEYLPTQPSFAKWFLNSAYKWLSLLDADKDHDLFNTNFKTVTGIDPDSPEWLKAAQAKGQQVYQFVGSNELTNKITHVIHWLNALIQTDQREVANDERFAREKRQRKADATAFIQAILANRMSFADAVKNSKTWFTSDPVPKEELLNEPGAVIKHEFPDGYTWRWLSNNTALEREGKAMQHCVGANYRYPELKQNKQEIWSLRNTKNEPVGTMRLSIRNPTNPAIVELKGKQNRPMSPIFARYTRGIRDAAKLSVNLESNADALSLGYLVLNNKVLDEKDFKSWLPNDITSVLDPLNPDYTAEESYILGNYEQLSNENLEKIVNEYLDEGDIYTQEGFDDYRFLHLSPGIIKLAHMYYMGILPKKLRQEIRTFFNQKLGWLIKDLETQHILFAPKQNGDLSLLSLEQLASLKHLSKIEPESR